MNLPIERKANFENYEAMSQMESMTNMDNILGDEMDFDNYSNI